MQFGYVERPAHRSKLYDKDRFEVCNHRYSAFCDGSHGAAVLNDCKYGISMNGNALEFRLKTADNIRAFLRVRLPHPTGQVSALDEEGNPVAVSAEWEERTRTLLASYDSHGKAVYITAGWAVL